MSDALRWGNWAAIEVTLKSRFMQNPEWLFILVKDKAGEIVISTDDALTGKDNASYLPQFDIATSKTMTLASDPWEGVQQSIHYQDTEITGNIFHKNEIVGRTGEIIFDAYVKIIRNDKVLGSVRAGFSRRKLEQDIKQLQFFLLTIMILALLISLVLVIAALKNMLHALTELTHEMSKISIIDNPKAFLAQLQSICIDKIKVSTYELKALKKASMRFQQQLVLNVEQTVKYAKLEMHARRMEAVAKTTQMLAHDIRKPFTMIQMILQSLQYSKDPYETTEMSKKFLPDVQAAICAANDMIEDVMEIDRAQKPRIKALRPIPVMLKSLKEVCQMHPKAEIAIKYDLKHQHLVNADEIKLQRVFSNIFGNAVQAMKNKGTIEISTGENPATKMMTFCIANDGVYIPHADLPKIFDAFYTKNKSKGTGLGLAIAHRIIMAHGGEIWCESSKQNRTVQFFFRLPFAVNALAADTEFELPNNLCAFLPTQGSKSEEQTNPMIQSIDDPRKIALEKKLFQYCKANHKKIRLCILDDETFYQNGLVQLILKSQPLHRSLDVCLARNSREVMALFADQPPDLLICDADLGPDCFNGFQVVKQLRTNGHKQAICIHSNRSLPKDYKASVKAGAQAFLPKPMTREHLIKFIVDSIPGIQNNP